MKINQIQDNEQNRAQRNLTSSQKRAQALTKEGVVVNSFIKEPNVNMNDLKDSLIISDCARMPEKINEQPKSKVGNLIPIAAIATGTMGAITLLSMFIKRNAKVNLGDILPEKKLPTLTRNLAINEETHQAIYQMVQCPNQKTILAGVGVLTLSAMAFMGKIFIDGFKDVWVKKKEADIQKNLQENLISVETQSFSGKIQIIRSMLSDKAKDFEQYLNESKELSFKKASPFDKIKFKGSGQKKSSNDNRNYLLLGGATLLTIVGLGFVSMKNLSKGKKLLEGYIDKVEGKIGEIVEKSTKKTEVVDRINLKNMIQAIDADPKFIKKELDKLNWDKAKKDDFIEEVLFDTQKSTAQADKAMGGDGTPKPAFYSHVNDYRAFFYNWLLDTSNPLFRNLFLGVTGVTAVSYGGKVMGEAIKDVQVKKVNAETELDLQKRLVSTELRNFKAKKDSAIEPLVEEFYTQVKHGKGKQELKTMADNILFEVKNGPPFVYS